MRRRQVGYGLAGAALCLGGAFAACGGGGQGAGYVALGAAGPGPDAGPTAAVRPSGEVELVPLDDAASRPPGGAGRGSATPPADVRPGAGPGSEADTGTEARTGSGSGGAPDAGTPTKPGRTDGPSRPSTGDGGATLPAPSPTPRPGTTPPATPPGPAVLNVGEPLRGGTEKRWCETVTLKFRNTGGSPVRSGSVIFGTHIIGALGIDWATVESAQPLPTPIPAGAASTHTYTVCVESWRVPLGMHIETRDVRADY
ncbi:hypothetical protein ACFU5O_31375 [Streptomyces sp. NPDC057445]|uniref:hypothetical protein n=1 Tax=Streptomyces sp. NPDC057445 TaxID=3346136 RepID=UPI003691E78E